MGTLVKKGFLKPIRYISQIFEQKEEEMQIGFPTDVKHVAHIGCDGPNSGDASWMKNYHSAPINLAEAQEREASNSQDGPRGSSADTEGGDSTRSHHSRRHKSVETLTIVDSEPAASSGAKKSRRGGRKKEPADQDVPTIPKQSRRRSKDDGGSVRSSKSKAAPPSKKDAAANGEKNEKMEAIAEL